MDVGGGVASAPIADDGVVQNAAAARWCEVEAAPVRTTWAGATAITVGIATHGVVPERCEDDGICGCAIGDECAVDPEVIVVIVELDHDTGLNREGDATAHRDIVGDDVGAASEGPGGVSGDGTGDVGAQEPGGTDDSSKG